MNHFVLTVKKLAPYDLVVLSTNHDECNTKSIYERAKIIIDYRDLFKVKGLVDCKVFKA